MGGEGPKKPRVLKRKGREVEEALLFEDQMDEAALEQWERKMGLRQEEASHPAPGPEGPAAASEASQEIHLEPQRQREQAEKTVVPKTEPSWRQSRKLRWMGLVGVRLYLEEKGPVGKSLFLVGAVSLAACVFFAALLWVAHRPELNQDQPNGGESREIFLELIVPLKEGKAGLLLCLSLELEGSDLPTPDIRRELFELISPMDPAELMGDEGIRRLRASVAERLSSRWPWVKGEGIRFVQYLIL